MREILFRAKAIDRDENREYRTNYKNGDWVYGLLTRHEDVWANATMTNEDGISNIDVAEQTLGQYTGLADKNGTKIFEGDILELHDKTSNIHWTAIVEFGNPNAEYTWGWQLKLLNILEPTGTKQAYWNKDILLWVELEVVQVSCEVIGNLHDNPELLEKVGD